MSKQRREPKSEISAKEYEQVKEAYENLKKYASEVAIVIKLEKADRADNHMIDSHQCLESLHSKTLRGYKAIIDSYLAVQKIPDTKLANISNNIRTMSLADSKNDSFFPTIAEITNIEEHSATNIDNFINEQVDILLRDIKNAKTQNAAYLSYINIPNKGNFSHTNIIKYSKENGIYYRTIYNAGMNVDIDNSKLDQELTNKTKIAKENFYKETNLFNPIYSAVKFPLKEEYQSEEGVKKVILQELKDSIYCESDQAFRDYPLYNELIKKRHEKFFDSPTVPDKQLIVNLQLVSNCTTRSIREALRHNIDASTFRDLYDYVTKTKQSEMLEILEGTIKCYEKEQSNTLVNRIKNFIASVEKSKDFVAPEINTSPPIITRSLNQTPQLKTAETSPKLPSYSPRIKHKKEAQIIR